MLQMYANSSPSAMVRHRISLQGDCFVSLHLLEEFINADIHRVTGMDMDDIVGRHDLVDADKEVSVNLIRPCLERVSAGIFDPGMFVKTHPIIR